MVYHEGKNLIVDIFGLGFLLSLLFTLGYMHVLRLGQTMIFLAYVAWVIVAIVGLGIAVQTSRYMKARSIRNSSGLAISASQIPFEKVLKEMDSTGRWYTDENEANRELVSCLKVMGFDAEYQYKLPNKRIADARVRNIIVEGKLSPNSNSEVDTLMGQLNDYTAMGYGVDVVIYGKLENQYRQHIEDEIATVRIRTDGVVYGSKGSGSWMPRR